MSHHHSAPGLPSALPAACSCNCRQMLFWTPHLLRDAGRLTPRAWAETLWWPAPEVLWPHSSFLTPPTSPGRPPTAGCRCPVHLGLSLATWVPSHLGPASWFQSSPPPKFLPPPDGAVQWSEPLGRVRGPWGGHFPSCVTASKECHLSESESSPLG